MNSFSKSAEIKQTLYCILILIFATTVVYFNSLKGSFQFDDIHFQQRIWVSDLEQYQKRVEFLPFHTNSRKRSYTFFTARPTVLFTLALNNTIGKNRSFGFHLLNLIFHVLTTIVVFVVIRLAFQLSREYPGSGTAFALTAALAFSIHPVFTESVTYISSRSSELLTLFYLMGVWFFLLLFRSSKTTKIGAIFKIFSIVICFYLSLTSKIVAVTFPVVLALLFLFLICTKKYPRLYKKLTGPLSLAIYASLLILILTSAFIISTGGCIDCRHGTLQGGFQVLDSGKEIYGNFGYFFIQIKIIVFYYLKIFLWPINLNVHLQYPFTNILEDPTIIVAAIIGVSLICASVFLGGKWSKFCAGWFIFTLAPTSSILPLNDLAFEHRMYLPATLGLCPLFAMAIRRIPQNIRFYSLAFIFISLSVLTAERNKVWVDELQLWKDVLEKSPNSPLPYTNLGKAYYDKGDHGKALAFMKKSIEMNGLVETSHYNLANIYMDMDRLILSEKEYRRTIEINPKHYQSYLGLGSIQNQTGKLQEAEISYLKAIEIRSTKIAQDEDYSLARINLGEVYGKMGRFEDSIRESQAAVKLTPNSFKAYYNIGTANIKLNRLEKSVEAFLKCLDINSKFENALFNLAFVYQKLNQFENSNLYFSKFLEIKKSFPKAHILMGINYAQMNKITESIKSFKKAIILDPKNLNARTYLAKAFAQKGNFDEAIKHLEIALKQNPNLNSIRIQLSLMYWKNQNQPLEAKKLLQMALQFSGNPEERLKISHWLQELSE